MSTSQIKLATDIENAFKKGMNSNKSDNPEQVMKESAESLAKAIHDYMGKAFIIGVSTPPPGHVQFVPVEIKFP